MTTAEKIQHAILKTLQQAEGHPLPESVLIDQVEYRVRPRPAKTDIQGCLMRLEGMSFLMKQDNPLADDDPMWLLDEKGQAHVTRMRI